MTPPASRVGRGKVRLCEIADLAEDALVVPVEGSFPARSLLVLLVGGEARAYWNLCRHLPIPLDGGLGRLPSTDGDLVCRTHGARFRAIDGVCVGGPCEGAHLDEVLLTVEGNTVYAFLDSATAPMVK